MNIDWQQIIKSSLGLKLWVLIWVAILFIANTASLWYLDYPSGLWTAIAMFCFVIPVNLFLLFYQNGVTRAMSIPHFVWVISSVMIAYRLFFSSAEISEEEMLFGILLSILKAIPKFKAWSLLTAISTNYMQSIFLSFQAKHVPIYVRKASHLKRFASNLAGSQTL